METITITHRIIGGKNVYYKRFDDYEKGYFGRQISKAEYLESSQNKPVKPVIYMDSTKRDWNPFCYIVERITYGN